MTLIGANGAGKSTLLMTVCGNPRARAGTITLDGEDITALPTHEIVRRGVAQVPEGRRIFPRMSVFENLQMGATLADPAHFQHDLERVFAMFPRLAERREQRGGTLSGGEQQMLAIGRALMSRPRLLLLDEPSLGLAPLIVRQIFEAIGRIAREEGVTIFLVEQNAFHALRLADRGYVLANGRVRLSGTGQRAAGQRRGPRGLPRGRPRMSPLDTFMFDWFGDTLVNVLLFNLVLVGARLVCGRPCRGHHLASVGTGRVLHGASFGDPALFRLCAGRRRVVVARRLPARLGGAAGGRRLRLSPDARAPDGAAISLALPAQRLAGLGGAALS